MENTPMI